MIAIKILVILSIIVITYNFFYGPSKVDRKFIKEINEIINENGDDVGDKLAIREKLVYFIPFKITQEELNKMGDPFPIHLDLFGYTLLKIGFGILFFIGLYVRFNNLIIGIIGIPIGFWLLDLVYKRSNKKDLDFIRLDLERVYNSLRFSIRSGESLGVALSNVYIVARRSARLRNALLRLAAKINMTADIEGALDDFKGRFNFDETNLFADSLKQALETGLVENVLEGQSIQLNRKNTEYINTQNEKIDKILFVYGGLIFAGAMALVFMITFGEVGNSLKQIFM